MSDENNQTLSVIEHIKQYYKPIFLCLYLLSNSLSVYVLFCTKLRYYSSSIYLGALAISDNGVLGAEFGIWFRDILKINGQNWWTNYVIGLQILFCFLSMWIVVAFTVQRYIVIKWPLLRRSLCTVNRAKIVVIGLVGLAVLYSLPWFIIVCGKKYENFYPEDRKNLKYWWWATDAVIMFVLPATLIVMFNILIVYNIRKQNHIRRNLILSSAASNENTQNNDVSHIKITKMFMIISSLFVCLNAPLLVCSFLFFYGISGESFDIIWFISQLLWHTNYGINFFLYYATGKNFRRELIIIFTKYSDAGRNVDTEIKNYE